MEQRGIVVKTASLSGLAEEAGLAYKNISDVVETCDLAGIDKKGGGTSGLSADSRVKPRSSLHFLLSVNQNRRLPYHESVPLSPVPVFAFSRKFYRPTACFLLSYDGKVFLRVHSVFTS